MRGVRCIPVLALLGAVLAGGAAPAQAQGERDTLRILFTHDTHDHWFPTESEGGVYGGYTRLATLLRREREAFPSGAGQALVTLDAGDFSMGSLLQTIYATDAPELRALGAMGYDATTFGNHEFDYRAGGLAAMLDAAVESGDPLPAIVEANYRPPESDAGSRAAWENYGVTDYTVIERGLSADGSPLRIAVFGVMGEEADSNAPMSGMAFEPVAQAAERVVEAIRTREEADFIVCLSHSGTDNGKGEDYELARKVEGIDVILSGHTHTTLEEPIRVGDTLIVSCGADTANLGRLTVERNENGGLELVDYALLPVDETVPEDPEIAAMAEAFQRKVEEGYLRAYGLGYGQVLAENPWLLSRHPHLWRGAAGGAPGQPDRRLLHLCGERGRGGGLCAGGLRRGGRGRDPGVLYAGPHHHGGRLPGILPGDRGGRDAGLPPHLGLPVRA